MRFTESKKKAHWIVLILGLIVVAGILLLGFCGMAPTQQTIKKTIVFEAD